MSNFINTPDVIGEEVATARIIEGTVTEYADDRVNSIGKNAFYKRKQLTSVNFPNATTVGGNAFYGCSALTNVELPSWSTVNNGSSYIFQDCTSLKTVSFPSLTATMDYMFYRCASLISVVMSTVTSLAQGTFLGCAGLTTLDFPKVTSIGTNVFRDCSKLTDLVLRSETVASLAYNNAFQNTPFASGGSGGRVFVPRSLIESYQTASQWSTVYAGGSCQFCAIEDYSVDGTITGEIDWTSMSVARSFVQRTIKSIDSEAITSVGDYAFYACSQLTSIDLPSATSVGDFAFYQCSRLTSIDLPSATSVGKYAFCSCSQLTSIDLPLVTSIGSVAFENCSKLTSTILRSETLCTLASSDAFRYSPFASGKAGGTLLVPSALLESYKTATNWSSIISGNANNRVLALEDYTVDGTITGEIDWDKLNGGGTND